MRAHRSIPFPGCSGAFTLLELVLVLVIMGILAALAVPRMSRAVDTAREQTLCGNIDQLRRAVELYAAEHADRGPEIEPNGSVTGTAKNVPIRLMRPTDALGNVAADAPLGPYLRCWPVNPYNGRYLMRIDGPAAGSGVAGWRLNSATRNVEADHAPTDTFSGRVAPLDIGAIEGAT
jgi:prepilin-type N-terminal cleavage/methylation domain-containing protein